MISSSAVNLIILICATITRVTLSFNIFAKSTESIFPNLLLNKKEAVGAITTMTKAPSIKNETYAEDIQNYILQMDGVNKAVKKDSNDVRLDINEIFRVSKNVSIDILNGEIDSNKTITECVDSILNNINFTSKCNYTLAEEKNEPSFTVLGTVDTVAVAAGICLLSAIIGYFSCVGYRRYLQRKFGDNQIVAQEDVYDTTDLRYFEI